MFMSIILFGVGGMMLLFAYLIGAAFLIAGGLSAAGIDWAPVVAFAVLFISAWIMIVYVQRFDGNNFDEAGRPKKRYYLTVNAAV